MAQCGGLYPSVFMVDKDTVLPPLPPRLSRVRRRSEVAQILLFLLVSLALFAVTIEALVIYHLHQPQSEDSPKSSKMISDDDPPTPTPGLVVPPSKPVAHLTDGRDVVHGKYIMSWSTAAGPLLYEMTYKDQSLVIQKEGYYYVYSKVFFSETEVFHHSIEKNTQAYDKSIILLLSRKIRMGKGRSMTRSNSYLGGVFHLNKGDRLFVKVNNASQIVRHWPYENVFGAYMI